MMKFDQRIKKLEQKLIDSRQIWATFAIRFYEDPAERARVQKRLVNDFVKAGNPAPTHCIFLNELPFPEKKSKEGFLSLFIK